MISGRLRRSVTIRRKGTTKNSVGEFTESYTTVATRTASVEPINGREYWAVSGEHSDVTTRIRIRWDSTLNGVKAKDEVVDAGYSPQVVYDVQSVIRPRETSRELILMCTRNG